MEEKIQFKLTNYKPAEYSTITKNGELTLGIEKLKVLSRVRLSPALKRVMLTIATVLVTCL